MEEQRKVKKEFTKDIYEMSITQFFNEANEVLDLKQHSLTDDELLILDFFMKNKELNFINLSHEATKSIYFYSPQQKRFVPMTFEGFCQLIGDQSYKLAYLKFLYSNLEFSILTKLKQEKDAAFLYNIKFDNGTLISKGHNITWDNKQQLSFNNIHLNLHIAEDTDKWIREHKHYNQLMSLLKGISKEDYLYFIDMLASVFIPNSLSAAIFWILSEGGKGKSSFMAWFSELIGGNENVSNLKIDDFVPKGGKPNYNLPFLNGKLMNLDDDYSGVPIGSSGFLKQFATGKNRVQVDFKQNQPISFMPKAQLFINTNEAPIFKSFDSGDKRRNIVFNWEGNWKNEGIEEFSFMRDKEFQELFITLLVWRAIHIAKEIEMKPEIYTITGYYIHNMPEGVRKTTGDIKTEESENILKVNDYINNGEKIVELQHNNIHYIDTLATHKLFNEALAIIGDKMNYKDFLKTLQVEGFIPSIAERIPYGEEDKKKQVYRRLK